MSSDLSYRDRDTFIRLASEMNNAQMARALGCSTFAIGYWRDRHGLPRSTARPGFVKWQTNRDFFARVDTAEKAYVLGFVVADGCIHKNGKAIMIALKASDAAILQTIADAMNCDAPLHDKISKGGWGAPERHMKVLNLSGRKLVADLAALGVTAAKSLTATFPEVPAHLESHLVRGLWDRDGWIGKQQFSLVGTQAVVDGAAAAIRRHTGCTLRGRINNGFPALQGSRRDAAALRWMYSGATISLERKADAFRLYWS